ncbi:MAG: hypothetical protein ACK4K3_11455 [Aquabacterium sp.]|jgi:hypothetical protein
MHAVLAALQAALNDPTEATLTQVRETAWYTPLWFAGSMQAVEGDRTLIQAEAQMLEGFDHPFLFAYIHETQARGIDPAATWLHQPLGVLTLLADEKHLHVAVIDGEHNVVLSHDQLTGLRDLMTMTAPATQRDAVNDNLYVDRISTLMVRARSYCMAQPDVRSLHLAAVAAGSTPMFAVFLLDAANAPIHQRALQQLHAETMRPSDKMLFLDRLDPGIHTSMIAPLSKQDPVYRKQPDLGWWGRMKQRWHSPRLVILDLALTDEAAA